MKKNRKVPKKMSVVTRGSAHLALVVVVLFIMVIINLLSSSSCQQLMKTIGESERQIARLDDEISRESTRWELTRTPERIERALAGLGLKMKPARADQNVQMRSDGTPYPGQLSVARLRQRSGDVAAYRKVKR